MKGLHDKDLRVICGNHAAIKSMSPIIVTKEFSRHVHIYPNPMGYILKGLATFKTHE
jgi:hypothetical protein